MDMLSVKADRGFQMKNLVNKQKRDFSHIEPKMSSTVLPPLLNSDLPMQNGQRAVDFIKENKLLNKSKFNTSKRARSLVRATGRPIGESSF